MPAPSRKPTLSKGAKAFSRALKILSEDHTISEAGFQEGLREAILRNAPKMTQEELAKLIDRQASLLYALDKELARRGIPKPGNNPNMPN